MSDERQVPFHVFELPPLPAAPSEPDDE